MHDDDIYEIGSIWASMLIEVFWNMVDTSGFSDEFIFKEGSMESVGDADSDAVHGNTRFLRILITALEILPCSAGFQESRDAILAADKILYDGTYYCDIWRGFTKRGLGPRARASDFQNDFRIPIPCKLQ